MKRNYYLAAALLVAAALAVSMFLYARLPQQVPIHWGWHGQADRFGDKTWAAFLGPMVMAGMLLLFRFLPWLSPKRYEIDATEQPTYLYIMLVLIGLFGYLHLLALLQALGIQWNHGRALTGGIFLIVVLLGNVLGKVPRNFYVGVRTPWTLADDRVWHATHRLAAKTMVAAGLIGFLAVVFLGWIAFSLILLFASLLGPALYSLVFYKRLASRDGR